MQFTRKASGRPDVYKGAGKADATLTQNMASTVNLAFTNLANTGAITGTIVGVTGFPAPTMTLNQQIGVANMVLWSTNSTTTADANFPMVPAFGGNSFFVVQSQASSFSSFSYPRTQTSDVTFTMLAPAVANSPAAAATGVTTTTPFQWTAPTNVINELILTLWNVRPVPRVHRRR
jgi:hypothetical protein